MVRLAGPWRRQPLRTLPVPTRSLTKERSVSYRMRASSIAWTLFLTCPLLAGSADKAWQTRLARPDPEYAQIPFWFWNDQITDDQTRHQLAEFRSHGVYGFIIHARMGLPRDIEYMGERWLGHVRFAVDEASKTGMKVVLYDEGMYPSGSAHGKVVGSNPEFATKGLAVAHKDVSGPAQAEAPRVGGGRQVAVVLARRIDDKGTLDLSEPRWIEKPEGTIAVPEGRWRLMTFACVKSGGHIRGVHVGEEDGQPGAPPSADLLNFEAMKAFIRFAYDPYHRVLKDHFGKTVIAMFTDEPGLLGRGGRGGLVPWTDGLADDFARRRGYRLEPLLPALFYPAGNATQKVRDDFHLTLAQRLDESYYQPISRWCQEHGIALTGHPSGSDEIRPLRLFQIPGQDMVWRWLLPESPSALEGAHSTVGKCSSSVARHDDRRRNANEIYGAYGWHLTMDEMKWLADWLIVRGVNMFYPHAFYYTIRGERAYERPPDLGMHNAWWPHYRLFADYTTRLCGLMTDSRQVCEVAVLSVGNRLPWRAAKWLYQNQVDFNYLEDWRLCEQARIADGRIHVGPMSYSMLVIDQDEPLTGATADRTKAFAAAGGRVRTCRATPSAEWVEGLDRDVRLDPPSIDLRVTHVRRDGVEFYLLVNEGAAPVRTTVTCRSVGRSDWFDAWSGRFSPAAVTHVGPNSMSLPLDLGRRESIVLCVEPGPPRPVEPPPAPPASPKGVSVPGPWEMLNAEGQRVGEKLGNWLELKPTASYAGTLRYQTRFHVDGPIAGRCTLDLGKVGDWAVVRLNGQNLGPRFWAPYAWNVATILRQGENELVVEVTNSLAARYDAKHRRPSGLFGPVEIRIAP